MVADVNTKPSVFAVFRNRNFTYIWTGQLISTIGKPLTSLAASIVQHSSLGKGSNRKGIAICGWIALGDRERHERHQPQPQYIEVGVLRTLS